MFKFIISFLILPILLTINFAYSKPSVFSVFRGYESMATAFYIGEGKFVTNFHVVATDKQNSYAIATPDEFNPFAKIIHLDAKNDLAVLKVDPEFMKTLEETMSPLTLSEAPNLIKNSKYKIVVIDYHHYDEEGERVQHDINSNYLNQDLKGPRIQFASTKMKSGMSGSPILDAENQVIGIFCCEAPATGFAIPVAKLLELLKTPQLECESDLECIKQEIKNLKKQANNGDAIAQFELAECYEFGTGGVSKDLTKAVTWYKKAAEQGNSNAQNSLGDMYQYGNGVPQDFKQAVYWYKKSAEQGDIWAQDLLGDMYQTGDGVPQDFIKAVDLYQQSAKKGNSFAQYSLANIYIKGREGVPKNFTKAMDLYQQAVAQGNQWAQYSLANKYHYGKDGVSKDFTKAVNLYKKAAAQGNQPAKVSLVNIQKEEEAKLKKRKNKMKRIHRIRRRRHK